MPRDAIVFFSRVRLTCSAFSSMNSVVPQSAQLSSSFVAVYPPCASSVSSSLP